MYNISKINQNDNSCDYDESFGMQNAFDRLNIVTHRSSKLAQEACGSFSDVIGDYDSTSLNMTNEPFRDYDKDCDKDHILSNINAYSSYTRDLPNRSHPSYQKEFNSTFYRSNFQNLDKGKLIDNPESSKFHKHRAFGYETPVSKDFKSKDSSPSNTTNYQINSESFIKNDHQANIIKLKDLQFSTRGSTFLSKREIKMAPVEQEKKIFIDFSKKVCVNEKSDFRNENHLKGGMYKEDEMNSFTVEDSLSDNGSSVTFNSEILTNMNKKEHIEVNQYDSQILTLSSMKNTEKSKETAKFNNKIAKLEDELKKIRKKKESLSDKERKTRNSYNKLAIKMKQKGLKPKKSIFVENNEDLVVLENKAIETLSAILKQKKSDE